MSKKIAIGGHRGMGCTDHNVYQDIRDIKSLPVENTYDSIEQAFLGGADYIETDAVMSADGVLFTIHNVVPKDHFFGNDKPTELLNKLSFADIAQYKTGRFENGAITPFVDTLNRIAQLDPKTLPWAINIEIKGVQGSGQNYEENDYLKNLAETVKQSKLPVERVLFSSFSLQNILSMSHIFPTAHYGMLFSEKLETAPIYANHRDDNRYNYLPFASQTMNWVKSMWDSEAHKKAILGFVHPEILTIGTEQLNTAAQMGLGINAWALFEDIKAPGRLDLYRDTARATIAKGIFFSAITDYLPEMKALTI